jgi:hypothetical protein
MRQVDVLSIQRVSADERASIEAADPAVRLVDAGGWFDGEIRETWSEYASTRHPPLPSASGRVSLRSPGAAGPRTRCRGGQPSRRWPR